MLHIQIAHIFVIPEGAPHIFSSTCFSRLYLRFNGIYLLLFKALLGKIGKMIVAVVGLFFLYGCDVFGIYCAHDSCEVFATGIDIVLAAVVVVFIDIHNTTLNIQAHMLLFKKKHGIGETIDKVCELVVKPHPSMQNMNKWDIFLFTTYSFADLSIKEYAYSIIMSSCLASVSDEFGCKGTTFF